MEDFLLLVQEKLYVLQGFIIRNWDFLNDKIDSFSHIITIIVAIIIIIVLVCNWYLLFSLPFIMFFYEMYKKKVDTAVGVLNKIWEFLMFDRTFRIPIFILFLIVLKKSLSKMIKRNESESITG